MTIEGKGIWIWKIPQCESGNASAIATVAANAGFSHVMIKIADSSYAYNTNKTTGVDLIPDVVDAIRAKGMEVWGWHYVYGYNPSGEAAIAISQCNKYDLDGYIIDAEVEYTQSGRDEVARSFMTALRKGLPDIPVALSTYRWPSYHGNFPYAAFLEKCDYNMPQVYWIQAHNPAYDLTKSFNEFKALSPNRPMIPTGAAFSESGWSPTAGEVQTFLDTAKSLGCTGANIYSWDDCRTPLPGVWSTVVNYNWPVSSSSSSTTASTGTGTASSTDILDKYMYALNTMNSSAAAALYTENAVHVTAERTVQGNTNIGTYLGQLLVNNLTNGVFTVTSQSGSGETRHFTWTCTSVKGKVTDGSDTFGIAENKIAYHYSHYTITS